MPSHVAQSVQACVFKEADHCFSINKNSFCIFSNEKDDADVLLVH